MRPDGLETKQAPISMALDHLQESVAQLRGVTDRIELKLAPAMGPIQPSPTKDAEKQDMPEASTITTLVHEQAFTIDRLLRSINDMLDRVEL